MVLAPGLADGIQNKEGIANGLRTRLAIRYAVEGDLRFISHHDSLRLFERAMARARIPVRYSGGFNPKPRMSIVLPRSVGVASKDELLLVELDSEAATDDVMRSLQSEMPPGLELLTVEMVGEGDRRIPREVCYTAGIDGSARQSLMHAAERLLSRESVLLQRSTPGAPEKVVDIRPYISTIDVGPDSLTWSQKVTPGGTARPGEVLEQLGLPSREYLHRLCRTRVVCAP